MFAVINIIYNKTTSRDHQKLKNHLLIKLHKIIRLNNIYKNLTKSISLWTNRFKFARKVSKYPSTVANLPDSVAPDLPQDYF